TRASRRTSTPTVPCGCDSTAEGRCAWWRAKSSTAPADPEKQTASTSSGDERAGGGLHLAPPPGERDLLLVPGDLPQQQAPQQQACVEAELDAGEGAGHGGAGARRQRQHRLRLAPRG